MKKEKLEYEKISISFLNYHDVEEFINYILDKVYISKMSDERKKETLNFLKDHLLFMYKYELEQLKEARNLDYYSLGWSFRFSNLTIYKDFFKELLDNNYIFLGKSANDGKSLDRALCIVIEKTTPYISREYKPIFVNETPFISELEKLISNKFPVLISDDWYIYVDKDSLKNASLMLDFSLAFSKEKNFQSIKILSANGARNISKISKTTATTKIQNFNNKDEIGIIVEYNRSDLLKGRTDFQYEIYINNDSENKLLLNHNWSMKSVDFVRYTNSFFQKNLFIYDSKTGPFTIYFNPDLIKSFLESGKFEKEKVLFKLGAFIFNLDRSEFKIFIKELTDYAENNSLGDILAWLLVFVNNNGIGDELL